MNKEDKSIKILMRKLFCITVIVLATCCVISISQASDDKHHENHAIEKHSKIHLSHDLKVILNQEMTEIEGGMMKIIPAISAGKWEAIANIATKIKSSFIMKQKLTQKQLEELHSSLTTEFIEMDRNFHSTAGKLAHAAHQHDSELVNFYFYKLHSQCIKCHSKYASERFPNLKNIQPGKSSHD